jgi:hypothetical protein
MSPTVGVVGAVEDVVVLTPPPVTLPLVVKFAVVVMLLLALVYVKYVTEPEPVPELNTAPLAH